MSQAVAFAGSFRITSMARRPRLAKTKQKQKQSQRHIQSQSSTAMTIGFGSEKKKELLWQCVEGCGACCKLQKDPSFATPEEIFTDSSDVELYRSMIGPDGWCINYDKTTRKCSIYSDRPYFCRVESDVFQSLYGIPKKKFNQEACSSCKDTIKAIYGSSSNELDNFNRAIRSSTTSQNKLF